MGTGNADEQGRCHGACKKIVKPYPCRITEPKTPQQEMFKITYPRQRTMIEESACVILPCFKCKYDLKSPANDYGLMDYGAAWALTENILLAATAEGLGSVVHIPVKRASANKGAYRYSGRVLSAHPRYAGLCRPECKKLPRRSLPRQRIKSVGISSKPWSSKK